MQPCSFPKLPRIALILALASTMCLSGCPVSLREALTMKTSGSSVTYALAYDQTYTAMRTALRWSSDGTLEDHRDQGYVLVNSVSRYRGSSPRIIQLSGWTLSAVARL